MKKTGVIEGAMHYHKIVLLIVCILVFIGMYGLYKMPKQEFPTFTIRQGAVVAVYPGATSYEMEERVAKPLENFIFSYKEVNKKKTYSQSQDGIVIVLIELNDNIKDKDAFWSKFKHGLAAFKTQLPSGVIALQAKDDVGDTSSILITLESEQKTYRELEKYLEELKNRLRRIDAVANLRSLGLQNEQITVYLDQNKMAQYGIGTFSLLTNLFAQGFTTMSGNIDNSRLVVPIHVADSYNSEYEVGEQIVYSDPEGHIIRLKDIARIVREYPDMDSYIKNNGKKCILLSIEMQDGSNIVEMGKSVHKVLEDYKQELPKDVQMFSITDQSEVVNDSVNNFLRELLIAVISVIIVVVLLMPFRVACVSAISIPITIFCALALFYLFGIELNTVTLAALLVTLGMVVDDSIVIIDNYMEKLSQGMTRWQATIAAPKEFFMSVLSATLAISITFFPFLFTMHGMQLDFILSFPWAISIILGISLLVALLLTPWLQYSFIHKSVKAENKKRKTPLDFLQEGYGWLLAKCFAHPYIALSTGGLLALVGGALFFNLPQRLMPIADRNQFAVEFYLPKGTSIEQTAIVADSLEHILRKDNRIISVTSFIGQGSPRFHATYAPQLGGTNFAQFIVNTKGNDETKDILDEYADKYADFFTNARVRFKQLDYSDAAYPIEIRLTGDNLDSLRQAADTVMKYMNRNTNLKLVRTNYEEPLPGVTIRPKQDECSRLGMNRALLQTNLAIHFNKGIPLTTMWEGDYPVGVILKSDRDKEINFSDLQNEYIPVMGGTTSVPLRQLADIEPDWTQGTIVRRNGVRTLSVVAEPKQGCNATQLTHEVLDELQRTELPQDVTMSLGGMAEKDAEILPMVAAGLVASILIIFFILLYHFKKIGMAVLNLSSIALCIFGAAIGMKIMDFEVSLTSVLGIVSLMGILVRNGIIMLDYAEELRNKENMTVREAAYHAGLRRMRPIFLTSAAASVGVLPMIMERSALWAPMGTVIFFGTLISMILISTILPIAYWLVFKKQNNNSFISA